MINDKENLNLTHKKEMEKLSQVKDEEREMKEKEYLELLLDKDRELELVEIKVGLLSLLLSLLLLWMLLF